MAKQQPLEERINEVRAEIEAFIEERVQEERKKYALPEAFLRHQLTRGQCNCAAYLDIKSKEAKDAA